MARIRVLVVDDSVVVRRLVTDALSGAPDIEVVGSAANGRIALTKVDQLAPDVVTMDIEMPEMDGIEAVRALRAAGRRLPIIMFSTLTDRGAVATLDALGAGASDYVTKPANVGSVQESLARVQALQPDNAFLKHDGPQLVADAYLGKAREAFRKGRDTATASVVAQATQALGDRADLRHASSRYALASALIKARGKAVAAADYQRLSGQLAELRRVDADGLDQLEADMKLRGQLPEGSLSRALDALKTGASAPSPITVPNAAVVSTPTPAPTAAAPATPTRNDTRPAVAAVKPAASGPATVAPGSAPASADPCGQPALVGQGRSCFDPIAGKRGPTLVVVSGVGGGKPYAISRTEITVNEFNRFCAATGKCTAITVADRESGVLPVSNITLAQARAYAAWLGSASGYVYRLPTDAEWMHAAQAGSGWKQAPDSNCVPPGAIGGDGSGGPISARGREPNPWGLVNLTGNVWEWVSSGGSAMVRGGSYTSYWSDCTVASHRQDSGAAAKDVGFRIVRELK